MTGIHLSNNNLSGTIPPDIFQISTLENLDLGFNELEGDLPALLDPMDEIKTIELNDNHLSGKFPKIFEDFCNRSILVLVENNLFACTYAEFCQRSCTQCYTIGGTCASPIVDCYGWEKDGEIIPGEVGETLEICTDQPGIYSQYGYLNGELVCENTTNISPEYDVEISIVSSAAAFCGQPSIVLSVDGYFTEYFWSAEVGINLPYNARRQETLVITQPGTYTVQVKDGDFCPGVASITIQQGDPIEISFAGYNPVACPGDQIDISSSGNATSFVWTDHRGAQLSNSQSLETFLLPAGTSTISVAVSNDLCSTTQDLVWNALPQPQLEAGLDQIACENSEVTLSAEGDDGIYEWIELGVNAKSTTITATSSAEYTVKVTSSIGCTNKDQVTVEVITATTSQLEMQQILEDNGFLNYNNASVTVTPKTYPNILESSHEITILTQDGYFFNITDELDQFLSDISPYGEVRGKVHYLPGMTCDAMQQLMQQTAESDHGRALKLYEEDLFILDIDGEYKVYYKFNSVTSITEVSQRSVVVPAIAYWILRKALKAGVGVAIHVGFEVAFEYWMGDHQSIAEAWEHTDLSTWELLFAAVEGAFDNATIQIAAGCGLGLIEYIFESTPQTFNLGDALISLAGGCVEGVVNVAVGKIFEIGFKRINKYYVVAASEVKLLIKDFIQNPRLVKAWKGLFNTGLRTDITWLTRASKWLDEGGEFVESGGKVWYRKGGDDIFEIKNQKVLPNKKEHYHQGSGGTPIGEPTNGYQVVKVGDDIKVKRVPDESPYQSSELNKLTDHPDAHVLERHGHDVTDDALNKRATEGIAPDGSTTQSGNPPPYSSKFESPDKIKDVLNNVGPGTPNWNPPSSGNSYAFDYPISGSAPNSFGYGIPSGGGSSVSMNRVKVVYKKDGGVWKLLTMYPQP